MPSFSKAVSVPMRNNTPIYEGVIPSIILDQYALISTRLSLKHDTCLGYS